MLTALQEFVEFLGPGNLVLGILTLVVAPLVDRLLVRRKRISYRVQYNSTIGLGPERLHDPGQAADGPWSVARHGRDTETNLRQLERMTEVLERVSVVVIRIRNSGSSSVYPKDFEQPLSFDFRPRVVWNARISEASTPELRQMVWDGLQFLEDDTRQVTQGKSPPVGATRSTGSPDREANLPAVRRSYGWRFWELFVPSPEPVLTQASTPEWHQVRLPPLRLRRREQFKLVVVLHQAGTDPISKRIAVEGDLVDPGLVRDEKRPRRVTLARVSGALAALLTVALVVALVFVPSDDGARAADCASGSLTIEGSTVFRPLMREIADSYEALCDDVSITVTATGSRKGVTALTEADTRVDAALSDGKVGFGPTLHAEQIAIVVYQVVVNADVGVRNLSQEQVRGVYSGRYTDWNQVRPGASLPIRIVGRGGESGSREVFERHVLAGGNEGSLSSDDCLSRNRDPAAPTIRCERSSAEEMVATISRTKGTIGYGDAFSVAEARKEGAVVAVALDGRLDPGDGVEMAYPFWTVEYLYTRKAPAADSLLAKFIDYVRNNDTAIRLITEAGYTPCTTAEGAPRLECNSR